MILQNIVFPNKNICAEAELYYRVTHGTATLQNNCLIMEKKSKVDFFTYFNFFSIAKWRKYTNIKKLNLSLICQGKAIVSLCQATMQGEQLIKKILETYTIETSGKEDISFTFDDTEVSENTVYYAEIESPEHLEIYGGSYYTEQTETVRQINIAIGICTYRREEFLDRTLCTLNQSFLQNKTSPLYGHLQVFVSDNANTLPLSKLNTDNIHVVYNRNVGGSGGFGRCMLEAVHSMEQYHFTHILLMDDDIKLDPEALFRTYVFLSVAKPLYQDYILSGALLRLDIPYIQHANGELWNGKLELTKAGYDLRREYTLVKNEEELPIGHAGWWYCCIPLSKEVDSIFPLPIFIHIDDIEYGLRYHGKLLTMNGIVVWHNGSEHRRSSSMEYYDIRNALICNAIHFPKISMLTAVKTVCKHMIALMLRYRYEDQLLTIKAVEDFCKGVSFLKTKDTVLLNQEISGMGYTPYDVTQVLKENNVDTYYHPPKPEELYALKKFSLIQKLTLNGWLLPAKKECIPIPFGIHPSALYRHGEVILFDPDNGKGFIAKRQHRQLLITLARCFKVWRLLNKYYDETVQDYQKHAGELITKEFWEQYLSSLN